MVPNHSVLLPGRSNPLWPTPTLLPLEGSVPSFAQTGSLGSAIVLLLVAAVELAELLLPGPPCLAGLGGTAGARGLGRLGAVAARRRPLQEVLGDGALQVLHGRRSGHADDPRVLEGLSSCQPLTWVHRQHTVNEVLCQVGHTWPGLEMELQNESRY